MQGGPSGSIADGAAEARPTRRARIRIGTIRIDGFRALRGVCLALDPDTTVLLGENNTGKSSLLEALGVALGTRAAAEEDLHLKVDGVRAALFTIDLTLDPAEGGTFDEHVAAVLGDAVQRREDGREYAAIRAVGQPAGDGSGIRVDRTFLRGWGGCDDGGGEVVREPRVGRRILDLVSFTLLDAKRDLVADLQQRRTAWGRLLARLEIPEELETDIARAMQDLGSSVIDASAVLRDLRARLGSVGQALGSSVAVVELAPLPSRVDELTRAIDVLVAAPGGAKIPLRLQGMGSRSLAALMVFQSFVEMRLGVDLGLEPLAVTALEEPEAHLHPQAQAAVSVLLLALPGQKLVSTHASRVAAAADLRQIRFLRREARGIEVRRTSREFAPQDADTVRRLVQRPHGDVLFARLVVLGDGATETAALPVFARAHWQGRDPEGLGVAFPEVKSLGDEVAQALVAVLDDLGVPWLALVDGDLAGRRAVTGWEGRLGRSLGSEVVWLPDGQGFERHLLAEGFASQIITGVQEYYGEHGAALIAERAARKRLPETDEKVLLGVLKGLKGTYGAAVAEMIVAEDGDDGATTMPSAVRNLLERADRVLGVET